MLRPRAKAARLDLRSRPSAAYLARLDAAQRRLAARIARSVPSARIRWRYRITLDALAVELPASAVPVLRRLAGVEGVYASMPYRPERLRLERSPQQIGAPFLWGPDFATAGNGVKIGIIDDGIDQTHPYFDPSGFAAPAGFPKGNPAFATAKVIVSRAFPPPSPAYASARLPFDPAVSEHGTHVAGIAAGDFGPKPAQATDPLSGVAPRAYLGNYKVLAIPTDSGFGPDGNSAEIAAAIEAAVADGMDVINLSLGEPEVEPSRDLVVQAIDAAADAGVVPVIAAGNDFQDFGRGSVGSPGNAPKAITVAAVTSRRVVADFSSSGPTPVSLELKPDVSAPGVDILSSVPRRDGTWALFSGTSMASPHVAGAAALLRERHPDWTVAQIKSALVSTADPVFTDGTHAREAPVTRGGSGIVDLQRADAPLLFTAPTSVSFRLARRGTTPTREIQIADAGGGAGEWAVSLESQTAGAGLSVSAPPSVTVPGTIALSARVGARAAEAEFGGFLVLSRGDERRRVPYWGRVSAPALGREPSTRLTRNGVFAGDTRGKPALVSRYRYPESPDSLGVSTRLAGPEQVFRVVLHRPVANFGVVVLHRDKGVLVSPRVVAAGDENRLTGYAGLPLNIDPYLRTFLRPEPVAGAVLPAPGVYDVVFDTPSRQAAGPFRVRFWTNDVSPPRARLLARTVPAGGALSLAVSDAGSGVDPSSFVAKVDGTRRDVSWSAAGGRARIDLAGLARGTHELDLQVSDYQEAKNMEDVVRILPNTTRLRVRFRVG